MEKATKATAVYLDPPGVAFRCGMCRFFKGEQARECTMVEGDIDPYGCCNLWVKEENVRVLKP